MRRRFAPLVLRLSLLGFGLVLGACGDDDGGSTSGATTASGSTAGTGGSSSDGSTSGSSGSSGSTTSTTSDGTGWVTTTSGGVPWMHECPDGTTTSYLEDPYDPSPCSYGEGSNAYEFCSCRYHELCIAGVRLFFPSGMSGWYEAGTCAAPCETSADCPAAPAGGTAVPECRDIAGEKWCVLDCSGGKTCAAGICSEAPEEICVGTYVP